MRAALLTGFLVIPLAAADWPQLLGPNRDGRSPETGLRDGWAASGPPVVWEKPAGAGFSGPVVAGERLVFVHRLENVEVVACLDAATGKEQWHFDYPTAYVDDFGFDEGPRSTPVIAGERVYTLGAEGRLHCLDLRTGAKAWSRALATDYGVRKSYFGVGTSPVVEGDLLLVNVGGPNAGIVGLDRETGKEIWRATNHDASYSSPVVATLGGRRTGVFFTREGIVLLEPKTGRVTYQKHWRARINASVNAATPLVAGDVVFVSASYGTGAIALRARPDGVDELWKSDDVLSAHYSTGVIDRGFVYGFDGRQEEGARLRCIELQTGKVRWTQEGFGCGSVILADGKLILLSEKGELVLAEANPDAYKEKARAAVLGNPVRSPIALADGRLYARDGKKLVCWNLRR